MPGEASETSAPESWLLLIHQIPPEPAYLRVKIGRRLQRVGALALKNSVYVLPPTPSAREDFQWIAKEIEAGGGEATVCEARLLAGQDSAQIQARFREARRADYAALADEARRVAADLAGGQRAAPTDAQAGQARKDSARLRRRLAEVVALDFFAAAGRAEAQAALLGLEGHLRVQEAPMAAMERAESLGAADEAAEARRAAYRGRTWVTRADVHVDRMACAWLIRRFVDSGAQFRFVAHEPHVPAEGEVRFDMFEAEFTHEGDRCTFEVLIAHFGLGDRALTRLAELIHDLDLRDGKYDRPETEGLGLMLDGIAAAHPQDEARLGRSGALLDDLYVSFQKMNPEA